MTETTTVGDTVLTSILEAPVCVIGAGPAGLATARALKDRGIPFEVLERFGRVGGVWNIDAPGTPMYEAAHFISSKTVSGFAGFPMGDDLPDYPSHRQVLDYLEQFAAANDLTPHIRFGTEVRDIQPDASGGWEVKLADGQTRHYRAVVCCTGAQWSPSLPPLPGAFAGEVMHSNRYRDLDQLTGKRVLVVGGGNSACDIVVDASRVAAKAVISMRRGYWFIPKHIFGMPSDVFAERGPHLPKRLEQWVFGALLRRLNGRPERLGLQRPDHRLFETHPVLNSNLFLALQHGDVTARPGIASVAGDLVTFTDGSQDAFDLIIMATGYRHEVPYAAEIFGDGKFAEMYLTIFSRTHRNLFGLSFTETNSGAYPHFDEEAQMIASYLADQKGRPGKAAEFDRLIASDRPDLSGGVRFDTSARHLGYVDSHALTVYRDKIFRRMGWSKASTPSPVSARSASDRAGVTA